MELWRRTNQKPVRKAIKLRKWMWISAIRCEGKMILLNKQQGTEKQDNLKQPGVEVQKEN